MNIDDLTLGQIKSLGALFTPAEVAAMNVAALRAGLDRSGSGSRSGSRSGSV